MRQWGKRVQEVYNGELMRYKLVGSFALGNEMGDSMALFATRISFGLSQ